MINDEIGTRMKHHYEEIPKIRLVRRTPVCIRLDGKAFHTFTRGLKRPFDDILIHTMQDTMKYLCEHIQGAVFGYTQSDEISLLLVDYKKLNSDAWFDYEVQKMCSISASMATLAFCQNFSRRVREYESEADSHSAQASEELLSKEEAYRRTLLRALEKGALFDARCFNIPKEEAANLLYWRQLDARRNSILMVGQAHFSAKQLHKKSCRNIQEMLAEDGIIWEDLPVHKKYGSCCVKTQQEAEKAVWFIDEEIPVFKDDRNYIEQWIYVGEDN